MTVHQSISISIFLSRFGHPCFRGPCCGKRRKRRRFPFFLFFYHFIFAALLITLGTRAKADESVPTPACLNNNFRVEIIEPTGLNWLFGSSARDARVLEGNNHVANLEISWSKLKFREFYRSEPIMKVIISGVQFNYKVSEPLNSGTSSADDPQNLFWGHSVNLTGYFIPATLSNKSISQIYSLRTDGSSLDISVEYFSRISFEASLSDVLCILHSPQIKGFEK